MKLAEARRYALSLPQTSEEPHFHLGSFRVKGKIFATIPPGDEHLNIFVGEEDRALAIATHPEAFEKLWWGKRVVGLKVTLARAGAAEVKGLLHSAWRARAPRAALDAIRHA